MHWNKTSTDIVCMEKKKPQNDDDDDYQSPDTNKNLDIWFWMTWTIVNRLTLANHCWSDNKNLIKKHYTSMNDLCRNRQNLNRKIKKQKENLLNR